MNSLFIVLPILTILMFDLGLTLEGKDFRLVMLRYKAVLAGMIGQLLLLPLIAWGVAGSVECGTRPMCWATALHMTGWIAAFGIFAWIGGLMNR